MSKFKKHISNNKNNKVKIDKNLYDKCNSDINLSFKSKGMFIFMLLEPNKIYTQYDFINQVNKISSINSGLDELENYGYIRKDNNYYIIKDLFEFESNKNSGYVYIIKDNYDNYKIGLTNNIAKRLKSMETSMPYKPEVIKILHCINAPEMEKRLHKKFIEKRLNGEWFKLDIHDIDFIKHLKDDFKL